MDIRNYDEFISWVKNDTEETARKKKEALTMFCKFHSINPKQLIVEVELAKKSNVDCKNLKDKGSWCSKFVASQRMQQFYAYLTRPESMAGLGYSTEKAARCWQLVRSFYTHHGVVTSIESMASWEDCPEMKSLRREIFGIWDWRT